MTAWSKVSQIEAGHFDADTAYASVDRHRLADNKPYIYRTHDGGKTWKNVVKGIPEGAFVNSVKEDPETRDCSMRRRSCACMYPSTTATTGSRCSSICPPRRCATRGARRRSGYRDARARVLGSRPDDGAAANRREGARDRVGQGYLFKPGNVRLRYTGRPGRHTVASTKSRRN